MLPKLVAAAIGDIVDLIAELSGSSIELGEMYRARKNPLEFINHYMRQFPTSSRQWGGMIYKASKYFFDQGSVLALYNENTRFDYRQAGRIPVPESQPDLAYNYRYNVELDVYALQHGSTLTRNIWVNHPDILTPRQAADEAIKQLKTRLAQYNLTLTPEQENSAVITDYAITSINLYDPRKRRGRNSR